MRRRTAHLSSNRPRAVGLLLLVGLAITATFIVLFSQSLTQEIAAGLFPDSGTDQATVYVSTPSPYPVKLPATGRFRIQNNKIYDPNGNLFIVKGIDAMHGRLEGHDANGSAALDNYKYAQRDFDEMKRLGVNLVRFFVSADAATLPPDDQEYIPDYLQEVANVVHWVTERGMVAEITNSFTSDFTKSVHFVGQLAARYKNNPLVWIEPYDEPNCESGDTDKCTDWSYWQQQQSQYVQAIRNAGMTSPVVVNTIFWSDDLSQLPTYHLADTGVIYGVHRYANEHTSLDPLYENGRWANLANQFPIIVDEVGAYNDHEFPPHLTWNQEFMDYVTNWVKTRGGLGAIAFTWYWEDDNSLTGNWRAGVSNGVLTQWGNIFYNSYLTKINSAFILLPSAARGTANTSASKTIVVEDVDFTLAWNKSNRGKQGKA